MAEKEADPDDAEGEAKEGEQAVAAPEVKSGKKKMLLIGAAAGILLLGVGGGAGLFYSGLLGGGKDAAPEAEVKTDAHGNPIAAAPAAANEHGSAEGAKEGAPSAPAFYSLGDILVNLSGTGKRPNFLKIKVDLELASEADKEAIAALKPRIIDNFQVYLRELRVEDLRGSAGLYRLREELLLRVTESVQPIRVRDVLFQEMLVQ